MLKHWLVSLVGAALLCGFTVLASGCAHDEGFFEKTGEALDDAGDEAGDAIEDAADEAEDAAEEIKEEFD